MDIDELLRDRRDDILGVARKHGVTSVRVFGSVARGTAGEDSDIDLLIEVEGPTTPWFPGGLVADLEAMLGRPVQVVEAQSLRGDLRKHVLEEAVPL
ncbi:MAG: nucleotidyltransferase family protein [Planctomycetota bacterium]